MKISFLKNEKPKMQSPFFIKKIIKIPLDTLVMFEKLNIYIYC